MKQTKRLICTAITIFAISTSAFADGAYDSLPLNMTQYNFNSDYNEKDEFGRYNNNMNVTPDTSDKDNVRRNKDAAYKAPSYGTFSGEFPTQPTNPYAKESRQSKSSAFTDLGSSTGSNVNYTGSGNAAFLSSTSMFEQSNLDYNATNKITVANGGSPNLTPIVQPTVATSDIKPVTQTLQTLPMYYEDGTLGTLTISAIGVKVKIYPNADDESMTKGVGHFNYTSAWDGNVGIGGHNRGQATYFNKLKDLVSGDEIIYTSLYGTRKYSVTSVTQIADNDFTQLGNTQQNYITLITCVENVPSKRICVQAIVKD